MHLKRRVMEGTRWTPCILWWSVPHNDLEKELDIVLRSTMPTGSIKALNIFLAFIKGRDNKQSGKIQCHYIYKKKMAQPYINSGHPIQHTHKKKSINRKRQGRAIKIIRCIEIFLYWERLKRKIIILVWKEKTLGIWQIYKIMHRKQNDGLLGKSETHLSRRDF